MMKTARRQARQSSQSLTPSPLKGEAAPSLLAQPHLPGASTGHIAQLTWEDRPVACVMCAVGLVPATTAVALCCCCCCCPSIRLMQQAVEHFQQELSGV